MQQSTNRSEYSGQRIQEHSQPNIQFSQQNYLSSQSNQNNQSQLIQSQIGILSTHSQFQKGYEFQVTYNQNIPYQKVLEEGINELMSSINIKQNQEKSQQLSDSLIYTETQNISILNSSSNQVDSSQSFLNDNVDINIHEMYSFFFNNDLIEYKYKQALKNALKLLQFNLQNNKQNSFQNIETIFSIGKIFYQTSQFKNAIEYFQKAQQIIKQNYPQKHYFKTELLHWISNAYLWLNQFKDESKIKQAQIQIQYLEGRQKMQKMAQNLFILGKFGVNWKIDEETKQKRLKYNQDALKLYVELNSGSDLNKQCLKVYTNMVAIYFNSKDFKKSAQNLENCLRIGKVIYEGNHRIQATTLDQCGAIYIKLGDVKKAQYYLNEAKQMYEYLDIKNQVQNGLLSFNFCILQEQKKDYQLALKLCLESYRILRGFFDDNSQYIKQVVEKLNQLKQKIEKEQSMVNSQFEIEISSITQSKQSFVENEINLQ